MGFSRQEYWSGSPLPTPGDLPNPGIEPGSPTLQADSLPSGPPGKPYLPYDLVIPLETYPREINTHKNKTAYKGLWQLCPRSQKLETSTSTGEWINRLKYIHKMDYCLAANRNYWYTLQHGWNSNASCTVEEERFKGYTPRDSIYMISGKSTGREQWLLGPECEKGLTTKGQHERIFQGNETVF